MRILCLRVETFFNEIFINLVELREKINDESEQKEMCLSEGIKD